MLGMGAMLAALLFQCGCETESASDSSVRISPSRAKVRNGQSVEFVASGGFDYSWAISDSSLGFISAKSGNRTVYTANVQTGTNPVVVVQTLTVTSTIGTTGASATNASSAASGFTKTAEAIIEHLPTRASGEEAEEELGELTISPAGGTLSSQGTIQFFASGEGPDYVWSINDSSNGDITQTTGSSTIYAYETLVVTDKTVLLTVSSNGKSFTVPILLVVPPDIP